MHQRRDTILKRSLYSFLVVFLLLCQTVFAADFSKVMILHTNDSHGYDIGDDKHIGMPIISQIKKDMESKGYQVIMLDAGDIIQGSALAKYDKGKSCIKFMNAIGYDAATLGNHEFDYGIDVLKDRMTEAKFPFVSSNIVYSDTGKTFVEPYVILYKPYGKIGIIGMTTPETKTSAMPKYVSDLNFLEGKVLMASTQMYVSKLIAEKCDLIIALGHMGSSDSCIGNRSEDIIDNVGGIDIFIDGHDHKVKNNVIGHALQVETGSFTEHLGCIVYEDGKWTEKMISLGEYTKADRNVEKLVNNASYNVEQNLSAPVGEAVNDMSGEFMPGLRNQEMAMGDFCSDAILWQSNQILGQDKKADGCIVNGGAIRTGFNAGKIKVKDVQSVFPFDNEMWVLTLKGSKLLEIIESSTQRTPDEMGGFPQVAGIEYTLNLTVPYENGPQYPNSLFYAPAAPGSRVTIKSVGGKAFDPDAEYRIVVFSFIKAGGDSYGGLTTENAIVDAESLGVLDNECLQNYIADRLHGKIGPEYSKVQGRIKIIS
ncbi:bifunctional UDP-sugar hydrolase/5'-nucleotidase [Anaerovibrio sp. RM50]|uniref:bifunctional metallophosphatase/5'-nucleotidase n=1 Tax=Anaerovibrio sp. RM50 TaxID=1200557 RepID=UPI000480E9A3|nr:bifunctional UDP-sugar hydrolase/5'-nucleotidase [Anaerovibrio sp. RM50]